MSWCTGGEQLSSGLVVNLSTYSDELDNPVLGLTFRNVGEEVLVVNRRLFPAVRRPGREPAGNVILEFSSPSVGFRADCSSVREPEPLGEFVLLAPSEEIFVSIGSRCFLPEAGEYDISVEYDGRFGKSRFPIPNRYVGRARSRPARWRVPTDYCEPSKGWIEKCSDTSAFD